MTIIGSYEVKNLSTKKVAVFKVIHGDLSYGYDVVPREQIFPDGTRGIGLSANTQKRARLITKDIEMMGWKKAAEKWRPIIQDPNSGYFGWLKGAEARKYRPFADKD